MAGIERIHQFLACAGDNIVAENTDTVKKNTGALLDASKEFGLEVIPEETNCMLMSRSQKLGQKHSVRIANRSFEDEAEFKYLGTTLTDQNCMDEEIKRRLNSKNAFYLFIQSLLSSPFLCRNLKVKYTKP
jgi:hypothetical protein